MITIKQFEEAAKKEQKERMEGSENNAMMKETMKDTLPANKDYEGKTDDLYDLKILIAALEKAVDEDTISLKLETEKVSLLEQDVIDTVRENFLNYYPNILISDEQVMNIYVKCDYFLLTKVEMFFIFWCC